MNMLKGSLNSLANEHIKNTGDLTFTKGTLSHLPPDAQNLLLSSGKQILPYEYLSSLDKLRERSLPPKSELKMRLMLVIYTKLTTLMKNFFIGTSLTS